MATQGSAGHPPNQTQPSRTAKDKVKLQATVLVVAKKSWCGSWVGYLVVRERGEGLRVAWWSSLFDVCVSVRDLILAGRSASPAQPTGAPCFDPGPHITARGATLFSCPAHTTRFPAHTTWHAFFFTTPFSWPANVTVTHAGPACSSPGHSRLPSARARGSRARPFPSCCRLLGPLPLAECMRPPATSPPAAAAGGGGTHSGGQACPRTPNFFSPRFYSGVLKQCLAWGLKLQDVNCCLRMLRRRVSRSHVRTRLMLPLAAPDGAAEPKAVKRKSQSSEHASIPLQAKW